MIKKWILNTLGLANTQARVVELERIVIDQKTWIDRHESNLMVLHKNVTSLQLVNKARVNPYKLKSKRHG
jgi:hypothetical protein